MFFLPNNNGSISFSFQKNVVVASVVDVVDVVVGVVRAGTGLNSSSFEPSSSLRWVKLKLYYKIGGLFS